MKFLVLVKNRAIPIPSDNPIEVLQAAREYLDASHEEGLLECVYNFADGHGAVAIVESDTAEQLWETLSDYPLYPVQEYKVIPLVNIDFVFKTNVRRMSEHVLA